MIIIAAILCVAGIYLVVLLLYAFNPFKRPLLTESDLSHREWFFFFYNYYAAKYLLPVRRSRRGSRYDREFFMNEAVADAPRRDNSGGFNAGIDSDGFVLSAVGDIMFRKDFKTGVSPALWDGVASGLFDADLTMGNMEFAVNDAAVIEKTIQFSIRSDVADQLLKPEGRYFDYLSTANNHINDSLAEGVKSSIDYLNSRRISHSGAWYGGMDPDHFPVFETGGIKTAVLAYSFSTNGVPLETDRPYGLNLVRFNALDDSEWDPSLILRHIETARNQGAELVIAQLHWGVEFEFYPPERIIERGQQLMEAGIDLIIGHHPHMLTPAQWYKRADGSRCLCFYSLGNITSSTLPFPMQNLSLQVKAAVGRNRESGRAEITGAELKPLYFARHRRSGKTDHRILPLYEALESPESYRLRASDLAAMRRCRSQFRRFLRQEKGFIYR